MLVISSKSETIEGFSIKLCKYKDFESMGLMANQWKTKLMIIGAIAKDGLYVYNVYHCRIWLEDKSKLSSVFKCNKLVRSRCGGDLNFRGFCLQ